MNNDIPLDKYSVDSLLNQLMITAETYGWSEGISPAFILWEQLTAEASVLPSETINQIKAKSKAAGGWWIWPDGFRGKGNFVTSAKWAAIRAEHNLP